MKEFGFNSLVISGLAVLLIACDGERENDPVGVSSELIKTAQTGLVENQILPSVAAFKSATDEFELLSNRLCSTTVDADKVAELQTGWKVLANSWAALEVFNFGPLNDNILYPKSILVNPFREKGENYTEKVRSSLRNKMTNDEEISVAVRDYTDSGILALEILSFETLENSPSTDLNDIASEYDDTTRKCDILINYAANMSDHADYIDAGWNLKYIDEDEDFKDIFLSGTWPDDSDSQEELLKSMQAHLDYMKRRHVLSRTAQISQTSYDATQNALEAIENLMEGVVGSEVSYFNIMIANGYSTYVDTVRGNFSDAKQALVEKDQPSFEAAVGLLDGNFKREIPLALQVDVGLGSISDGD